MEQFNPDDQLPPAESGEQLPPPSHDIDALPSQLQFTETPPLAALRSAIIDAYSIGEHETVQALISEYQDQGMLLVEELQGPAYVDGQIGLIIATATLRRDCGLFEACITDLQDAAMYAENMGAVDLAKSLQDYATEIATSNEVKLQNAAEIAKALTEYEDFGLDAETRAEIAELPFDEAFETAYGYLTQAGIDADEVLAEFMEQ